MLPEKLKNILYKWQHWEYWSVNIVYCPTFFKWIWYAIRFKKISFYKFSNPSFVNGGLYNISKMSIYKKLPPNLYPKTVFCAVENKSNFETLLSNAHFTFPLIVKPDKGYRGVGVQKVYSLAALEAYASLLKKDFLIQEIITFEKEMGLFYYRFPNTINGEISGITLKEFLTVEGDGKQSIEALLKANPRYRLQIEKLRTTINLSEILPIGEQRCLVPFGNHNRGTKFLNGAHCITPQLNTTFNNILNKIDGFYYGRLDIRYNTLEELEFGKNFSIIELNCAISEPTHIYDPKTTFLEGQKEIFRHQQIFAKIISQNITA